MGAEGDAACALFVPRCPVLTLFCGCFCTSGRWVACVCKSAAQATEVRILHPPHQRNQPRDQRQQVTGLIILRPGVAVDRL
jgi:hypothetical protein